MESETNCRMLLDVFYTAHCLGKTKEVQRTSLKKKLGGNKARDQRKTKELKREGWKVLTVWECRLKKSPARESGRVVRALN